MMMDIVDSYLPREWSSRHYLPAHKDYELVELPYSSLYRSLENRVNGKFNLGVSKIVRVENPYLYAQFLLKKEEYETRGSVQIRELFHDTAARNISSIVSSNLDWRLVSRCKYGLGVSFSPSPAYANQESSRDNGTDRAMIIADVLIQCQQHVNQSVRLPSDGYDTTVGNNGNVLVKFYDNEFYPKYVVYYESRPFQFRRRR